MVNITLSIEEGLKKEMENLPEINWSAVAREAIKRKILLLKEMDKILKNSKITEEDAIQMGRELNKRVWQKLHKK